MIIIHNGSQLQINWTIFKGMSKSKEDFRRALLRVFLVRTDMVEQPPLDDMYPVFNQAEYADYVLHPSAEAYADTLPMNIVSVENGTIKIDIPQAVMAQLPVGVYSLKAVWFKNKQFLHDATHVGVADKSYSIVQNKFALTNIQAEATNPEIDNPVLNVQSGIATYGYNGLDSYEEAVLNGETLLSRGLWIANLSEMNSRFDEIQLEWDNEDEEEPGLKQQVEAEIDKAEDKITDVEARMTSVEIQWGEVENEAEAKISDVETRMGNIEDDWSTLEGNITTEEQQWQLAESTRQTQESTRQTQEAGRVTAEAARVTHENSRISSEDTRASKESQRQSNESTRQSQESTRQSNESTRQSQETARETQASADHTQATTDHATAAADHTTAQSDHTTAQADHTTATTDHNKQVQSTTIEYAEGEDNTTAPASGWQESIPSVDAGNYLWTRTTFTYADNTTKVAYGVSLVPTVTVTENSTNGGVDINLNGQALENGNVAKQSDVSQLNQKIGEYSNSVASVSGQQYNNYIYGNFKNGDVVDIEVLGDSGLINASTINLRNDANTTLKTMSVGERIRFALAADTTYLRLLVANANVTGSGNITFKVRKGITGDIEKLKENQYGDIAVHADLVQSQTFDRRIFLPLRKDDKIYVKAEGTAILNEGAIAIALDAGSSFKILSKDGNFIPVTIPNNTEYLGMRINGNNITASGNIDITIKFGASAAVQEEKERVDVLMETASKTFVIGRKNYLPYTMRGAIKPNGELSYYANSTYRCTPYICINGISIFTIASGTIPSDFPWLLFDKNKNIIQTINSGTTVATLNKEAYYLRCTISMNQIETKGYIIPTVMNNDVVDNYTSISSPSQSIIYKAGDDILEGVSYEEGYIRSNNLIYTDVEGYYHTDYIPVGSGSFNYDGALDGYAVIAYYDKNKRLLGVFDKNTDFTSLKNLPERTHYIRFSTKDRNVSCIAHIDVVRNSFDTNSVMEYETENNFITRNGNELTIKNGNLECANYRLWFNFKINGYAEDAGNVDIANLGSFIIRLNGAANDMLTYTYPSGVVSQLPLPQRNTHFSINKGSVKQQCAARSLPRYKEIIGNDLFTIKYVGGASTADIDDVAVQTEYAGLSDKLTLSYVNKVLTIKNDGTTVYTKDVSSISTVGALVTALQNELSDYEIKIVGESTALIDDIATINDVCLVSKYCKTSAESSDFRYDAFPCYFNSKYDDSLHTCEIVSIDNYLFAVVDGESIITSPTSFATNYSRQIVIGNNSASCGIEVKNFHLDLGNTGDAEVGFKAPINGRIISKYNPMVIVLEAHGMWCGDSCDGKTPIYVDETPTATQAAVVPTEYRTDLHGLEDIAMSDKRFIALSQLAKDFGYVHIPMDKLSHINDGTLPKRCWTICFDDRQQYFFDNLDIRQVFGITGIKPCLAIEFFSTDIGTDEYLKKIQKLQSAGWETKMHGLVSTNGYTLNVFTMTSKELYDITSESTASKKSFNEQRLGAEENLIDWCTWIYSNGSANPNTIKAFEHLGIEAGIMTSIASNFNNSLATNKYYIKRIGCGESVPMSEIKKFFQ